MNPMPTPPSRAMNHPRPTLLLARLSQVMLNAITESPDLFHDFHAPHGAARPIAALWPTRGGRVEIRRDAMYWPTASGPRAWRPSDARRPEVWIGEPMAQVAWLLWSAVHPGPSRPPVVAEWRQWRAAWHWISSVLGESWPTEGALAWRQPWDALAFSADRARLVMAEAPDAVVPVPAPAARRHGVAP